MPYCRRLSCALRTFGRCPSTAGGGHSILPALPRTALHLTIVTLQSYSQCIHFVRASQTYKSKYFGGVFWFGLTSLLRLNVFSTPQKVASGEWDGLRGPQDRNKLNHVQLILKCVLKCSYVVNSHPIIVYVNLICTSVYCCMEAHIFMNP